MTMMAVEKNESRHILTCRTSTLLSLSLCLCLSSCFSHSFHLNIIVSHLLCLPISLCIPPSAFIFVLLCFHICMRHTLLPFPSAAMPAYPPPPSLLIIRTYIAGR